VQERSGGEGAGEEREEMKGTMFWSNEDMAVSKYAICGNLDKIQHLFVNAVVLQTINSHAAQSS
jgi:hypothetical protein